MPFIQQKKNKYNKKKPIFQQKKYNKKKQINDCSRFEVQY